jgi:hypothetical protein
MKQLNIPASDSFNFCTFLAAPSTVQDWNIQGLPADAFSTTNGVMVTRGRRWPLLIDPQVRHCSGAQHSLKHSTAAVWQLLHVGSSTSARQSFSY